jgi:sec-independent protein translocase protein TatA
MPGIGTTEIIVIVLILLLLFGGKKIPELMRGLGSGVKEFKKATTVDDEPEPRRNYDRPADDRRDAGRLDGGAQDDRRFEGRYSEGESRTEVR